MAKVKIIVRKDGPFRMECEEGSIEMVDAAGNAYGVASKPVFHLCRCGASANKPFCDGAHGKVGFQADESAVRPADPPKP